MAAPSNSDGDGSPALVERKEEGSGSKGERKGRRKRTPTKGGPMLTPKKGDSKRGSWEGDGSDDGVGNGGSDGDGSPKADGGGSPAPLTRSQSVAEGEAVAGDEQGGDLGWTRMERRKKRGAADDEADPGSDGDGGPAAVEVTAATAEEG